MDELLAKLILMERLLLPTGKFLSAKYTTKRELMRNGFTGEQADEQIESFLAEMAKANQYATEQTDAELKKMNL